jgi:endonuclease/exonuclease/phosphatase family metal-dependent hydrolase
MTAPNVRSYRILFTAALLFIVLFLAESARSQEKPLRLLTINVWSGLDYIGSWRMGEYEPADRRELRFQLLLAQIRQLDPDVVLLQEANPVSQFAARLSDSLSFDEIHQVCNAGIKFGPIGIPSNFKEGIAILARPTFGLKQYDVWKLSGSPGLYGDILSIHFDESIFSIVGKIRVGETPVYIVNVHLVAAIPIDSALGRSFSAYRDKEGLSAQEYESALQEWHEKAMYQTKEIARLREGLSELPANIPVIVAGDFNATTDSPTLKNFLSDGRFFEAMDPLSSPGESTTWDPRINENINFSMSIVDARGDAVDPYGRLSALYDAVPRKIDHIFLSSNFKREDAGPSRVVFDSAVNNIHASDHFGIAADIRMERVTVSSPKELSTVTPVNESTIEPLPIASYDTDTGIGYGAKAFLLNQLGLNESFDCVFFNSTEGERWYRLVFSLPDFELRQGKVFPIAYDLLVDYDKWIKNSFFGIGNGSRFTDREYYTREPLEISLAVSRGFSSFFVGQGGIRFKSVRNFNFTDTSTLVHLAPHASVSTATYQSLFISARYDSRNSYVNPTLGSVVQCDAERTFHTSPGNFQFTRLSLSLQNYSIVFYPTTVLALRWVAQGIIGENLPVQVMSTVGGNNTLRGSPQDRYLDKISAVVNAEVRFPLYWRFGGVVGLDAGKVWQKLGKVDLVRWATNPSAGLRLHMQTFVVRLDVGFGKETTGVYFNFGQIF